MIQRAFGLAVLVCLAAPLGCGGSTIAQEIANLVPGDAVGAEHSGRYPLTITRTAYVCRSGPIWLMHSEATASVEQRDGTLSVAFEYGTTFRLGGGVDTRGAFSVGEVKTVAGGKMSAYLTGSLAGGRLKGKLELNLSTNEVDCDIAATVEGARSP